MISTKQIYALNIYSNNIQSMQKLMKLTQTSVTSDSESYLDTSYKRLISRH